MPTDKQIEALLYHSRYCWWEEEKKKIMKNRKPDEIQAEIGELEAELEEARKREAMEKDGVIILPEEDVFTLYVRGMKLKGYVSDITVFHNSLGTSHARIELTCDVDR